MTDPVQKKISILYISQYFPPEIGATQTRAFEMAAALKRMGHDVTVLTEFPNHPRGVIPEKYGGLKVAHETYAGLDVVRTWVYARSEKDFKARILFYLSFCYMAIAEGLKLKKRWDIVYATSPPLFVGVSGYVISLLRRATFVMEVRDLWPESAVILGELSNPLLIRLSEALERFLYHRARRIVGVTKGIIQGLSERGVAEKKIRFIPNGANVELYVPGARDSSVLQEASLPPSSFAVMYTGLHGLMHGLDYVIRTARSLRDEKEIQFVFIGDGVRKAHLIELAGRLHLDNVRFMDARPENDLPRYIRTFDAGLVTTRKLDFCRGTLPVKLFSYMACGKPVILCVDGEARSILEESGAGIFAEPENEEQLREAILFLKNNPALCETMGRKGREYVERHFSRKKFAAELEYHLRFLMEHEAREEGGDA